ncbi:MAG: hypothetical protein KC584_18315, partial [Nitrospira sp.]|nr:hypothetical protein [Nitrospira sp.]
LVNEHPNNPYHSDGQKLLAMLEKKNPTLLASLPPDPSLNEDNTPNPSVIGQRPNNQLLVRTISHTPESPLLSAATAPKVTPAMLSVPTTSEPQLSKTACTIGTWCDSPSSSATTPPMQVSSSAKSCKTGEWC